LLTLYQKIVAASGPAIPRFLRSRDYFEKILTMAVSAPGLNSKTCRLFFSLEKLFDDF
jgi:hypothetical protein